MSFGQTQTIEDRTAIDIIAQYMLESAAIEHRLSSLEIDLTSVNNKLWNLIIERLPTLNFNERIYKYEFKISPDGKPLINVIDIGSTRNSMFPDLPGERKIGRADAKERMEFMNHAIKAREAANEMLKEATKLSKEQDTVKKPEENIKCRNCEANNPCACAGCTEGPSSDDSNQ